MTLFLCPKLPSPSLLGQPRFCTHSCSGSSSWCLSEAPGGCRDALTLSTQRVWARPENHVSKWILGDKVLLPGFTG
jgi:hypothetical protein